LRISKRASINSPLQEKEKKIQIGTVTSSPMNTDLVNNNQFWPDIECYLNGKGLRLWLVKTQKKKFYWKYRLLQITVPHKSKYTERKEIFRKKRNLNNKCLTSTLKSKNNEFCCRKIYFIFRDKISAERRFTRSYLLVFHFTLVRRNFPHIKMFYFSVFEF